MGIGFWVEGASPDRYFKDLGKVRMDAEQIGNAVSYACGALFPDYLFYASGSSVYAYSMTNNTGRKVYDFNAGATGTYLVDHIELERDGRRLWVAFRNGERSDSPAGFSGLYIQTDGGLQLREEVRHEGLADEIVDFESKY